MAKFDHVVIVTDMDGTFLGSDGCPVERNVRAIEAFKREGGHFTFATGRMHGDFLIMMPELAGLANAPAILVNGAYLYDFAERRVIEAHYLDTALVQELQRLIDRDYPSLGFRATTETGFLTENLTGLIARDLRRMREITRVISVETWGEVHCYKAVARGDAAELSRLRADAERRWPGVFSLTCSSHDILEFMPRGVSKATLLECLRDCCAMDEQPPVIYAVGDYENDYAMLRAADVAVCPTNAMPMIREIAAICPASNNEGVIAALIEVIEARLE
ncbi:MAG: HAD hydrolase family protein [Clostridia bacterium]|nr:HAD hydrolase family protein [Clostridia bacterium]